MLQKKIILYLICKPLLEVMRKISSLWIIFPYRNCNVVIQNNLFINQVVSSYKLLLPFKAKKQTFQCYSYFASFEDDSFFVIAIFACSR